MRPELARLVVVQRRAAVAALALVTAGGARFALWAPLGVACLAAGGVAGCVPLGAALTYRSREESILRRPIVRAATQLDDGRPALQHRPIDAAEVSAGRRDCHGRLPRGRPCFGGEHARGTALSRLSANLVLALTTGSLAQPDLLVSGADPGGVNGRLREQIEPTGDWLGDWTDPVQICAALKRGGNVAFADDTDGRAVERCVSATALLFRHGRAYLAHMGDKRALLCGPSGALRTPQLPDEVAFFRSLTSVTHCARPLYPAPRCCRRAPPAAARPSGRPSSTAARLANALILFSADGNEDPADIHRFRPLLEAGADMVIASRMCAGAYSEEYGARLRPRKWANKLFAGAA